MRGTCLFSEGFRIRGRKERRERGREGGREEGRREGGRKEGGYCNHKEFIRRG